MQARPLEADQVAMAIWPRPTGHQRKLSISLRILIYLFESQHIKRKLKDSLCLFRYGAAVLEVHELLEEHLQKTQRHFEFYK